MTSGNFHTVPLASIKVNREARHRKELKDVPILADSIRRLGLIHPIVVTRDLLLVAGERRYTACITLGWDSIPCQYTDELEDHVLRTIELEENLKRIDLSWQELNSSVVEYHELRASTDKDWTQAKTAEALGMDQRSISQHLQIKDEIRRGNVKILEVPLFSTARGITERNIARRDEKAMQEVRATLGASPELKKPSAIIQGDFNEWAKTYSGTKFNFIHCDFPYGIDADKMQQGGSVATHGGYDDSEATYFKLLGSLCHNLDRICTQSAHLMFWFSMHYYHETIEFIENESDFIIDPFPLIWLKSDNIGLLPDPQRGPRRIYETCLFGSRGDRKVVGPVSNAYAAPTDRSTHMSTKPEPVLRHFFRMFVDENSLVLDPTCGSGSALRAAESLGAAHIFGVELNSEFIDRANLSLEAARRIKADTK